MQIDTELSLTERLADPHFDEVDPHEVARELTHLYQSRDLSGVRKLRDAYLVGQGRANPKKKVDKIRTLVNRNLKFAAGLADTVARDGYEASGQLMMSPRLDGPIAKFYREATES